MATGIHYDSPEAKRSREHIRIRINKRIKPIRAEGYNGIYFIDDQVPKGKHFYFCRHSDTDLDKLVSIKKDLTLTVNFWGTVVTDAPIDFRNRDEVNARIIWTEDGLPPKIKIGQKVKWNDPGIRDYEPEERQAVLDRVFRVTEHDPESGFTCIQEIDGPSYAEVWDTELEII